VSSNEYRRNAAECLRVSALIGDPDSRRVLTSVAEAWNRLADQAENKAKAESGAEPSDIHDLRLLLKHLKNTAVAELDPAVRQRVGKLIARAVLDASK
jgi:hypothetical protein